MSMRIDGSASLPASGLTSIIAAPASVQRPLKLVRASRSRGEEARPCVGPGEAPHMRRLRLSRGRIVRVRD